MKSIEVCLTPHLLNLHEHKGKIAVVVDIFRATSTIIAALSEEVDHIFPVAELQACKALEKEGYLCAGERNGQKAEGFLLGNSPLEYQNKAYAGKKIALTTTNGTYAIEQVRKNAKEVLMGAFLNLAATSDYLISQNEDILIVCAGWKGKFNLEDTLYAGALVSLLSPFFETNCDAALAAKTLFEQNSKDLKPLIAAASHTKRLQNFQIEKDIDFCLTFNKYHFIVFLDGEVLKSKVVENTK
jgi:2-phosphosulfolactate phosphatase